MRVDGSLPAPQSPCECCRHGGYMAPVLLEVTLCLIPGSLLKEDEAACTVTHKKTQSAKHTFPMDRDWIINPGQLCCALPASGWAAPGTLLVGWGEQGAGKGNLSQLIQLFCSTKHNRQPEADLLEEKYCHLQWCWHRACFAWVQKLRCPILVLCAQMHLSEGPYTF